MPSLRRRRQSPGSGALTAAAKRVSLTQKPPEKPSSSERQRNAWSMYRDVPEIKELMLWRGNQVAKLRLYAACTPQSDPDGDPVPLTDEDSGVDEAIIAVASQVVRDLKSSYGGKSELLRRTEINLEVAGELYLVGFGERPPDPTNVESMGSAAEWIAVSMSEILYKPGTGDNPGVWSVKQSKKDKVGRVLDPTKGDDLFRIWMPDAEWGTHPDNALMGALALLDMLSVLNAQMMAVARSRIPAGILVVPNELIVEVAAAAAANATEGQEALAQKFMDDLVSAITAAVTDPSDVATLAPMVVRGPKEHLGADVFRWMDISRKPDEHLDKQADNILTRVFRGLDAPVELIEGHKNTTFRNAQQIDQDTFEDYMEPRAVLVCDAFTSGYFRPMLAKRLAEASLQITLEELERMFMWYDPQDLISQPDPSMAANDGHDRGTISDAAWRRHRGFDEADKAEPLELLIRAALRRGGIALNVTNALFEALDADIVLPTPAGGTSPSDGNDSAPADTASFTRDDKLVMLAKMILGPDAEQAVIEARAITAAPPAKPPRNPGHDLVDIDREFRTRVLIAADQAVGRALERAGNRLKGNTTLGIREVVKNVPAHLRIARIGPTMLADAGINADTLLDGAFDDLEAQFMQWGAQAQSDAIELVNRIVGGFTQSQRDTLGLRLSESLDESWSWIKGALTSLAQARMFDPTPAATLGEFDPSLRVPPGLVRQAAARAGGAAGITTGGSGEAWVSLVDAGTRPAGGIATGEILRGAMSDAGATIEGWQWDYGAAQRHRPFEPHAALSGVTFVNYDDPAVANYGGWPEFSFYMPGDHDGCMCDAIPIMLSASEVDPSLLTDDGESESE